MIAWIRARWFAVGLTAIGVVAAAIRWVNVLVLRPTCVEDLVSVVEANGSAGFDKNGAGGNCFGIWGDSAYYYIQGRLLARGHLFVDSYGWFASNGQKLGPSAGDPPLFTMFLAVLAKLGITSGTGMRVATGLLGVAGVVLIALLTRKLVGPRAGLIAGAIAAVYPMLWINDGMLLSETLYVPMITLALIAAYRFWERPSYGTAAIFGVALALAALTRGEALLLFAVMALPILWGLRSMGFGMLVKWAFTTWIVGGLLIAPWVLFNLTRFQEPVLMTSTTGAVLSSANCDTTYYGESIGYYGNCFDEYVQKGYLIGKVPTCDQAAVDAANVDPKSEGAARCWPNGDNYDESQRDKLSRDLAVEYMKTHKSRMPVVMLARAGRIWDVYVPQLGRDDEPLGQNVRFNWQVEGRGKRASEVGVLFFYALLPFAGIGLWSMWRQRIPVSPLVSLAVVITVTSAFTFGVTRYRVPVDVVLVVLAAAGVERLLHKWWPDTDPGSLTRLRPTRAAPAESPAPEDDHDQPDTDAEVAHA